MGVAPKVLNPELGARAEQTLTEKETLVSAAAAFVNFLQVVSVGDRGDSFQVLPMRMRCHLALCQHCQSRDQPSGVAGVH